MGIRGPAQCVGHLIDGLELGQDAAPDLQVAWPRRALEPCLEEDGDHQVLTHATSPDSDNSESARPRIRPSLSPSPVSSVRVVRSDQLRSAQNLGANENLIGRYQSKRETKN